MSGVCEERQTTGFLRNAGVSRTPANDRTWMSGLGRSEAGAEASRAKAQKVFLAALRCAFRASRKPRVTVHGHPSNACVRPMDGLTPARSVISRVSHRPTGCIAP